MSPMKSERFFSGSVTIPFFHPTATVIPSPGLSAPVVSREVGPVIRYSAPFAPRAPVKAVTASGEAPPGSSSVNDTCSMGNFQKLPVTL